MIMASLETNMWFSDCYPDSECRKSVLEVAEEGWGWREKRGDKSLNSAAAKYSHSVPTLG